MLVAALLRYASSFFTALLTRIEHIEASLEESHNALIPVLHVSPTCLLDASEALLLYYLRIARVPHLLTCLPSST